MGSPKESGQEMFGTDSQIAEPRRQMEQSVNRLF